MWNDVKKVKSLVQGMQNGKQPYFILRYTNLQNMRSDGEKMLGFEGYRFKIAQTVSGNNVFNGAVNIDEGATFFRGEFGSAYSAIPDTKHNRRLLCNIIGDAPVEVELEGSGNEFQKELETARKKNLEAITKRKEIQPEVDAFNVTRPAKKPEGVTEMAATMKKMLATQNNAVAAGFQ